MYTNPQMDEYKEERRNNPKMVSTGFSSKKEFYFILSSHQASPLKF